MKKFFITLIVIGIIAVGGYYAVKTLFPEQEVVTGPVYSTYEVVLGDIKVGVDTEGYLSPSYGGYLSIPWSNSANAPTSYIVNKLNVKSGDTVAMDDVVMELSAPSLTVNIDALKLAIQQLQESLGSMMNVPAEEAENVNPENGIVITAPISGRLTGFNITEGFKIEQGSLVGRIVNDGEIELTANLTIGEFDLIKENYKAVLVLSEVFGMGEFIVGDITGINTSAIPIKSDTLETDIGVQTGTGYEYIYQVNITAANPGLIQTGMKASIAFYNPDEIDMTASTLPEAGGKLMWTRYISRVEKYADEQSVLSTATGMASQVLVNNNALVNAGDPIVIMAGEDVRNAISAKLTEIREKRIQLMELEAQTGGLTIYAPCDGVVTDMEANIREGGTVNPGDWVGSIFRVDDMSMQVTVDDVDVVSISVGAEVEVTLDALPGQVFKGEVIEVFPNSRGSDGSAPQFIVNMSVVGNADIISGMQAKAYIGAGEATNTILVPLEGVFRENNQNMVEILDENGIPQTKIVEVGLINNRYAQIVSGVSVGDKIITGSTGDRLDQMSGTSNPGSGSLLPIQ